MEEKHFRAQRHLPAYPQKSVGSTATDLGLHYLPKNGTLDITELKMYQTCQIVRQTFVNSV